MGLGKKVCKLNLQKNILKTNNLVPYSGSNVEAIHSNMFGELMLHRILSNTDSTSSVTLHRCRGGESNTKISQEPL
jgi:hypothetical protein